jgi:predicted metalloprotease with PDZ domain
MNKLLILFTLFSLAGITYAQPPKPAVLFAVTMPEPATHYYYVALSCNNIIKDSLDFIMPVWTPGYYQLQDFAANVENFRSGNQEQPLSFKKVAANRWRVYGKQAKTVTINYQVKAVTPFVGNIYLDEKRGFITPGALFMYPDGFLHIPVTVSITPAPLWNSIATGMDTLPGPLPAYQAPDYDLLYDSPILMGQLESLPSFTIKGIPHYFTGYEPGSFDKQQFMNDLKKIVIAATDIIGDIPYKHYTFLAIGPGGGGIEHLNSAAISFDAGSVQSPQARLRTYKFLAHEYFHHYNVKRIRPIALGPFDYTRENKTNMLWVSEGFTVYYEYLILRRAGLMTAAEMLEAIRSNIVAYENKPGHLYQSATQASYETWSDGPFGRTGDKVNKTISYYDKGPVLGLLLDVAIRHATRNKKSLDDVMRTLYRDYYQTKKRGFTDSEFQQVCEQTAGCSLQEVFTYASTVQPIDYPKYFSYAGLHIDTATSRFTITPIDKATPLQKQIREDWLKSNH